MALHKLPDVILELPICFNIKQNIQFKVRCKNRMDSIKRPYMSMMHRTDMLQLLDFPGNNSKIKLRRNCLKKNRQHCPEIFYDTPKNIEGNQNGKNRVKHWNIPEIQNNGYDKYCDPSKHIFQKMQSNNSRIHTLIF